MQINFKIEDLKELEEIPHDLKERVIREYKKGYHFLLLYGKVLVVIVMVLLLEHMENLVKNLSWTHKIFIYSALGYLISLIIKIIEVNIIAKKVILDLIKELKKR